MEELTLRDYPIGVLRNILGTSDKQGTDRKLKKYGYGFTLKGSGSNRVYTITSLPDALHRFSLFCVSSLGFSPQTDFRKLRDFVFFLFTDPDFDWRPDEMMEEYLRLAGRGMTRQTIARYKQRLEEAGLIDTIFGEFVYYKVYKNCGVQEHEIITKEDYGKAWKLYWDWRNTHPDDEDSRPAYQHMYNKFGGVPRKQRRVNRNEFYKKERETLVELATAAILEEVSG